MSVAMFNQFATEGFFDTSEFTKPNLSVLTGIMARSLEFPDLCYPARVAWLQRVIEIKDRYNYSAEENRYLSQVQSKFEILFVGGCNGEAIVDVVRRARQVFPGKIILAVISMELGCIIASLLNAGADDVFTVEMDVGEAQARVISLLARAVSRNNQSSDLMIGLRATPLIAKPLSRQEEVVLNFLCDKTGLVVRYDEIINKLLYEFPHRKRAKISHLYTITSNLRSKIFSGARIISVRMTGYVLENDSL